MKPLAMLATKDHTNSEGGHGFSFGRFASDGDRSFAEATLQAKHIRIDA